jgi:plastocyanin
MRRIVFLVTVAALVLVSTPFVVSAVGAHKQTKAVTSQQPKAVASKQPEAVASRHPTRTVVIQGFRFKPANITIKRGTRVRWINKDSAPHTVTANNRAFGSGHLRKGQRYSHTFKTAGKKGYHCNIHPFMRGSIVVQR